MMDFMVVGELVTHQESSSPTSYFETDTVVL